jgi:hypothetical protein
MASGPTASARASSESGETVFRYFAMIAGLNVPTKETGDRGMGSVNVLRNKAEQYLEKARAISDRQHARLLLVQAHNYLKCAEEREAQQLSAR